MGYGPRTHAHSEATRLLCAGAELHAGFRQRVIDELVGHAERPVPPSLGVDVRPVLAHALRARRREARTALALLAVWAGFLLVSAVLAWDGIEDDAGTDLDVPLADRLRVVFGLYDLSHMSLPDLPTRMPLFYAGVVVALWAGRAVRGRETLPYAEGGVSSRLVTRARRTAGLCLTVAARLLGLSYWATALAGITDNPYAVIFPLLLAAVVWLHRIRVATVLREELSRETFGESPPPELPPAPRYRRIGEAIDREQHAPATLYDPNRPFVGAGSPHKPWSFALELRRKGEHDSPSTLPAQDAGAGSDGGPAAPALTARDVLDMIRPRLLALRDAAARTSRDRLRDLEIEEFVYLPAGVPRDSGVYAPQSVREHLADAVEEGGEARRHFLRVRVGAWHEQVVVSLLVRVHTQGGMLVVEVVPHVLGPVDERFRVVDAVTARGTAGPAREALLALLAAPAANVAAGIAGFRTLVSEVRLRLSAPEQALPDAPLVSVREMAAAGGLSLFQEMDVSRYVKTIQDRIAGGVRDALEQRGYRTDRLEQQIVQVRDGGVFIRHMSGGAVATGTYGQAEHVERTPS